MFNILRYDSFINESFNKKILYHGSRYEFDNFELDRKGINSNSTAHLGIWFSDDLKFTKNFTQDIFYGDSKNSYVYECEVKMKSPLIYEPSEKDTDTINKNLELIEIKEKQKKDIVDSYKEKGYKYYHLFSYSNDEEYKRDRDVYTELDNEITILKDENVRLNITDSYEKFKIDMYLHSKQTAYEAIVGGLGMAYKGNVSEYRNYLIQKGYDSIIIKNTNYDGRFSDYKPNTQYIILDVNNINIVNVNRYDG